MKYAMKSILKCAAGLATLSMLSACGQPEPPRSVSDFCLIDKRISFEPAPAYSTNLHYNGGENTLFDVHNAISDAFPDLKTQCTIADVRTVLTELRTRQVLTGTHHEIFPMRREQAEGRLVQFDADRPAVEADGLADDGQTQSGAAGLPVASRADSQDLCFLAGEGKRSFLERHGHRSAPRHVHHLFGIAFQVVVGP